MNREQADKFRYERLCEDRKLKRYNPHNLSRRDRDLLGLNRQMAVIGLLETYPDGIYEEDITQELPMFYSANQTYAARRTLRQLRKKGLVNSEAFVSGKNVLSDRLWKLTNVEIASYAVNALWNNLGLTVPDTRKPLTGWVAAPPPKKKIRKKTTSEQTHFLCNELLDELRRKCDLIDHLERQIDAYIDLQSATKDSWGIVR